MLYRNFFTVAVISELHALFLQLFYFFFCVLTVKFYVSVNLISSVIDNRQSCFQAFQLLLEFICLVLLLLPDFFDFFQVFPVRGSEFFFKLDVFGSQKFHFA